MGTDENLIEKLLPIQLALEYLATLSHKSGVSKELMTNMRLCFGNGMGPSPFAKALSTRHHLRHDKIEWHTSRRLQSRYSVYQPLAPRPIQQQQVYSQSDLYSFVRPPMSALPPPPTTSTLQPQLYLAFQVQPHSLKQQQQQQHMLYSPTPQQQAI
ncbi:hypothetical protein BDB00DRAFT_875446 [Zychaea mexicana]|uniref:uncharacterized protein n=1 Tax=Zychaea mexicana TaxID=64656 RepID=UPI0022FDE5E8|nr:uncharacterized protein BDB00DRAFT_875446 [Zychaea mexicana]KAI9490266.1 hypothetical protein BDB00DRAFT_875446 [Zychaea mexicana]